MADLEFNTTEGRTIARELLIAYLNTGTPEEPVWSAIGKRVEESDEEMDWSEESIKDIFGNTWTTLTKPVITQSFDPIPLDAGDVAAVKLWNLAIKDQDAQALAYADRPLLRNIWRVQFCGAVQRRIRVCNQNWWRWRRKPGNFLRHYIRRHQNAWDHHQYHRDCNL